MEYISEQQIASILQEVIEKFLIPRHKELGMPASGNWMRELEVKTSENHGEIWGVKYTEQLVNGRSPGTMPPINAITRWMKQKGINANPWAIAKAIEANGTSWYQKNGSDLLEVLSEKKTVDFINHKIASYLAVTVQLEITRKVKEIFTK